ncbi:hypothetical protein HPY86_07645 [candidate division WOR-3 bacterium]|nr:hypothetical protein [candidate division WOR-3 bacterium]
MSRFIIRREVEIAGWGVKTNKRVKMKVRPGVPGSGIVFNRVIKADWTNAGAGNGYTYLTEGKCRLLMVEHFLATCYCLGVTDIEVEVEGEELPFGDGSARQFVRLLQRAGLRRQNNSIKVLRVNQPVGVNSGERFIIALPGAGLKVHIFFEIKGVVPMQFFSCRITPGFFIREIAPARTFGKTTAGRRVEKLVGFKLRQVNGWLFPARWRFVNEPCRHKVLDLVGDLALLGCQLEAELIAFNPGHRLNLGLVQKLGELLKFGESRIGMGYFVHTKEG